MYSLHSFSDMISCCFLDHQAISPRSDPRSAALVTYFEGVALVAFSNGQLTLPTAQAYISCFDSIE